MDKFLTVVLKEITGAPSEFQLLPSGKVEIQSDEPAYLDEAGAREIIADFKARGNDMVIDYEHQSLADVQAPAAGWIKDMAWKGAEGLSVLSDWTSKAAGYLENREYRYFSPVMLVRASDRKIVKLVNVALTNNPRINNLRPIVAKFQAVKNDQQTKEDIMIEQLKKLLGLAADAGDSVVMDAVNGLIDKVAKAADQVATVACKELLEALGAKSDAKLDDVVAIVASLKAPADVAKTLSLEVAALRKEISAMKQDDLVQLALKEGKTSPEELEKWGRDLALKNPESFKQIVLSRPAGSVIPVTEIVVAKDKTSAVTDDVQAAVNAQMGIDADTFKKYNK
jgi:phage I-like protein